MRYFVVVFSLLLVGCYQERLRVKSIGSPDYPVEARNAGIQGIVTVEVEIDTTGKVIWADGSGESPVLTHAAEANARQWRFGPFPRNFKFPAYHLITYRFLLKGHPSFVVIEPPDVSTELPDGIEISAPPVKFDDTGVYVPNPQAKKNR